MAPQAPDREAWLKRLSAEMEKLGPLMPFRNPLPESEGPAWVLRSEELLSVSMFPAAKLRDDKKITPKRMGALIGHQCSHAVWMMELFAGGLPPSTQPVAPETQKRGEEILTATANQWYPAMRRFAKRALCSCVDQSYEDMRDFLQGYADGFARKLKTFNVRQMGSSVFEILIFLIWYRRAVEQLNSISHLHQVLVKTLGIHRVGDLKRTEKICQRIGLQYRKPGRPTGSQ